MKEIGINLHQCYKAQNTKITKYCMKFVEYLVDLRYLTQLIHCFNFFRLSTSAPSPGTILPQFEFHKYSTESTSFWTGWRMTVPEPAFITVSTSTSIIKAFLLGKTFLKIPHFHKPLIQLESFIKTTLNFLNNLFFSNVCRAPIQVDKSSETFPEAVPNIFKQTMISWLAVRWNY